jgi:hypothetical protein
MGSSESLENRFAALRCAIFYKNLECKEENPDKALSVPSNHMIPAKNIPSQIR